MTDLERLEELKKWLSHGPGVLPVLKIEDLRFLIDLAQLAIDAQAAPGEVDAAVDAYHNDGGRHTYEPERWKRALAAAAIYRKTHEPESDEVDPLFDLATEIDDATTKMESAHEPKLAESEVEALKAERDALRKPLETLREAINNLLLIIGDSDGVAGYHKNGDVASWDEFEAVDAARAALADTDPEKPE